MTRTGPLSAPLAASLALAVVLGAALALFHLDQSSTIVPYSIVSKNVTDPISKASTDPMMVLLTSLLVVVGSLQALIFWKQIEVFNRQLIFIQRTADDTHLSTELARQSAEATKAAASIAQSALAANRAWMIYDSLILDHDKHSNEWRPSAPFRSLSLRWKNLGHGPALNVRIYAAMEIKEHDPPPILEPYHKELDQPPSFQPKWGDWHEASPVGPGNERYTIPVSIYKAKDGARCFLYSIVEYEDVLKIKHVSEVCLLLKLLSNTDGIGFVSATFPRPVGPQNSVD